ncbi:4-hydroxy-tetrahydrodipicolinate synthase [Rummeliibacillus pycnus]|uniref:4-hydroxy-tetrahydrodipicolinate synthase n=1 Tax=Rummeliibacillus pycnus TaxID=101070 RepID=UPI000C9A7CD0|nr:4-hydroxy-tetrahydrodipicolinate synthase [Rummeliibacillus pycnus]
MNIGNIATAMITPFCEDGSIHFKMVSEVIEHLIANGTDAIVVCGTTGESPTLSHDEKVALIRFVVKTVDKRIPVIAGTGSNNTQASMALTKEVEAAGADGVMLVAPYYNKPSQQGMYTHFATIANCTSLPVMLYNIPGRSIVNIQPQTILELSKIPNIQIVKEASGSLDQMTEILAKAPEGLKVYSGDDGLTLPLLAIGGSGVISVAAHVVGNDMQKMVSLFKEGNHQKAATIHQALLPVIRALFATPSPSTVKYALTKLGIGSEYVRLPIVTLTDQEKLAFDLVWEDYLEKQKQF